MARYTLFEEITGATVAGCASTIIGHPLDTLKVHMQTNSKLTGTIHAAKSLIRTEGSPLIFFRGISPPLFNAIIMNTVMFSVFHEVKQSLPEGMYGSLVAGLISGFATACLSTPTDFAKIQSQLRGVSSAAVLAEAIRLNPFTLGRGHVSNLAREGVFTMVYLGLFDRLKSVSSPNGTPGLLKVAFLSSFTGGLAWISSYPFDTVKSVVQGSPINTNSTTRKAIKMIWSRGGFKEFYRGVSASTGRAILVTSTRMIAYEYILDLLRS